MRKIREILRLLWYLGLGVRQTARSCSVSHSTVSEYRSRAQAAHLTWDRVEKMDLGSLEGLLFPPGEESSLRPLPAWSEIHAELRKPGVTLQLLWEEYKAVQPEGYQYSRFCELYGQWRGRLDLSMRQEHKAGEKLFVDYCGQTVAVSDPKNGTQRSAQIFVAVLGASNYTYAEATWSQTLPDWVGSHVRAFEFFGGVAQLLVPDNLKSGVNSPCRYEPELNATYQELASHYETAVIPARVRKPKDKAKVETGVLVVERWILAALRHRQFFSLAELNRVIAELLEGLNNRRFKKLPGTRRSQFDALDKPALKPLPATSFEYADWYKVRVRADYHVEVEECYYSVPYQLVDKKLEVRVTASSLECLHKGRRIACHARLFEPGSTSTLREHMPRSHREYAEWTPQKLVAWAQKNGPATAQVVDTILTSRPHPLQGFQSCLGIQRLAKSYSVERLEAACERAVTIHGFSYKSIRSILQTGLDRQKPPGKTPTPKCIDHDNIRGASYYENEDGEEVTSC